MESEAPEATGVTRSQNVIHVVPHDRAAIVQFLAPALERVSEQEAATQLLILTPDPETAVAITTASLPLVGDRQTDVIPITNLARAARMFRSRHARAVAGTSEAVLSLLQASALKLDQVNTVILAWTDDASDPAFAAALEAVIAETPKTAARVMVASRLTPEVEAIAERYVRRARRVIEPAEEESRPTPLHYVAVTSASRADSVRRVLDSLDPLKAGVFVRSSESEEEVRRTLRALGYGPGDDTIAIVRGAAASDAALIVLYDLPASKTELRTIVGETLSGKQIVALAKPRQLALLRDLAGGGGINPLPLPGAVNDARTREESMRNQLRAVLADGAPARELLALEPLLAEYDGIEIAAAALKLLDRVRERSASAAARTSERGASPATAGAWTNIFVTAGARDSLQPGDLVGAILNESGIVREHVGKVDIRDGFSLIQIATADVATVVNALNGKSVKGRRVVARLEREPGADGGGESRPRGGSRPPSRGFGPRGDALGRDRERPPRDRDRPPRDRERPPRDRERPPRDRDRPGSDRR